MTNEQIIASYAKSFERQAVVAVEIDRADWLAISAEITQLRGNLRLAEEGLASATQEIEGLKFVVAASVADKERLQKDLRRANSALVRHGVQEMIPGNSPINAPEPGKTP